MIPRATDRDFETIQSFDDLTLVTNDLSTSPGFTLTAVVRNEMFFLPAFLQHYRALGVERFVFLDDQSDDGTREFLATQTDCMVVESQRRFSQWVEIDHPMQRDNGMARVRNIWTNLLLQKFALGRWSVHVDADEFLRIPEGMSLSDVAARIDRSGTTAICCVMLDLYPATIGELADMRNDKALNYNATWYYDARQHFKLPGPFRRPGWMRPKVKYEGSRARLMHQHQIRTQRGFDRIKSLYRTPRYNVLRKIALIKLQKEDFLVSSHWINTPVSERHVLPLEHFKFSGQLYARAKAAIESRSHHDGSVEYVDMLRLLQKMTEEDASFLCPWSSADRRFSTYARNKVALGVI